jgi:hypothetical protein
MRALRLALLGSLIGLAGAAQADRVYDLSGVAKLKALGESIQGVATGTLTLEDDRSYTLTIDVEGDVSESIGFWLEDRGKLQLLQEEPEAGDAIEDLEAFLSSEIGIDIRVVAVKSKETIKRGKSGDLKIKSSVSWSIRPAALPEERAVKITESLKLIGVLRP